MANDRNDEPGFDGPRTPPGGIRGRLRSNPATKVPYRIGVFVLGLLCIAGGIALAVLPGPLTIPPVLLGLWIWSWEFRFAEKLFDAFQEKAQEAWDHAKQHPVLDGTITVVGLVLAGVAMWALIHFDLVDKGRDAVGL